MSRRPPHGAPNQTNDLSRRGRFLKPTRSDHQEEVGAQYKDEVKRMFVAREPRVGVGVKSAVQMQEAPSWELQRELGVLKERAEQAEQKAAVAVKRATDSILAIRADAQQQIKNATRTNGQSQARSLEQIKTAELREQELVQERSNLEARIQELEANERGHEDELKQLETALTAGLKRREGAIQAKAKQREEALTAKVKQLQVALAAEVKRCEGTSSAAQSGQPAQADIINLADKERRDQEHKDDLARLTRQLEEARGKTKVAKEAQEEARAEARRKEDQHLSEMQQQVGRLEQLEAQDAVRKDELEQLGAAVREGEQKLATEQQAKVIAEAKLAVTSQQLESQQEIFVQLRQQGIESSASEAKAEAAAQQPVHTVEQHHPAKKTLRSRLPKPLHKSSSFDIRTRKMLHKREKNNQVPHLS
jgi:hypothetical protein